MSPITRRSLLAGFAASAAGRAVAQAPLVFSTVSVDVSHLRAIGVGPLADLVQATMTDELRRVFADRIGGGGPRLVVRVTTLHISAFANQGKGLRGSVSDSIEGEALLIGAGNRVVAHYPQIASVPAHGTWYDPLDNQRRTERVARAYAQWLRRTIS
jgi:hypothetical protein